MIRNPWLMIDDELKNIWILLRLCILVYLTNTLQLFFFKYTTMKFWTYIYPLNYHKYRNICIIPSQIKLLCWSFAKIFSVMFQQSKNNSSLVWCWFDIPCISGRINCSFAVSDQKRKMYYMYYIPSLLWEQVNIYLLFT